MAAAPRAQIRNRWTLWLLWFLLPLVFSHAASAQNPCPGCEEMVQAQALLETKDLDSALAGARQALALQERAYGPDDPRLAEAHVLVGQILREQKDLDGALEATLRALRIAEGAPGFDRLSLAAIASNVGVILHQRGDLDGALENHRRALGIFESAGPGNLDAIQVLANIGSTLEAMGNFPGAIDATRKALQRDAAIFGSDHIRVIRRRRNLGMILLRMGDLDGALQETRRVRQILERAPEPSDAELAITLNNLGQILRYKGELDGALGFLEQARRLDEKTYGPDHTEVAGRLHNIAGVLREKGDLHGALAAIQKALRIDTQVSGLDHPNVARDSHALAQIFLDRGDLDGALKACQTAISIDEVTFGTTHPNVARDSETLAAILLAQGDAEGALRAAQRALEIADGTFETDAPVLAVYARRVGRVLQARGDLQGARSHFERAHRILGETYGPDNPATRKVEADLQGLDTAWRHRIISVSIAAVLLTALAVVIVIVARRRLPARGTSTRPASPLLPPKPGVLAPTELITGFDGFQRLGPFRLEGRLGAGGMGVVYRAYDERLDRWVAVKLIPPDKSDETRRERLRREARASARLSHPSIIQVFDFVHTDEVDGIVMELVEGEPLSRLLRPGPLDLERALPIAREIAEALAEAHAKGIVHRDLKTENVIVTPTGHAKILDFGIAKQLEGNDPSLTSEGAVLGTYRSMAPEQAHGQEVDHRADLFAFGTLLYELVTGRSPFQGPNGAATLRNICWHQQSPAREVNPRVPEDLSELIDRLLRKEPHHRPRDSGEVVAALAKMSSGTTPTAETIADDGGATLGPR